MINRIGAALGLGLLLAASAASAQGVDSRPTTQTLHIEIKSADPARAATVRFRVSGEPITVTGSQPTLGGTVTTPSTIEVPFARLEVVFIADPSGPELVLTARPGAGQPALYITGHAVRLTRDDRGRVRVGAGGD
jgi:hypothetical protein